MRINYNGRQFRPFSTTGLSDTTDQTLFTYMQSHNVLSGIYTGGHIQSGHLIGLVDSHGHIDMRYHHVTHDSILMTGMCQSIPHIMPNGKLQLHETWQWTNPDIDPGQSKGTSILEEI